MCLSDSILLKSVIEKMPFMNEPAHYNFFTCYFLTFKFNAPKVFSSPQLNFTQVTLIFCSILLRMTLLTRGGTKD